MHLPRAVVTKATRQTSPGATPALKAKHVKLDVMPMILPLHGKFDCSHMQVLANTLASRHVGPADMQDTEMTLASVNYT